MPKLPQRSVAFDTFIPTQAPGSELVELALDQVDLRTSQPRQNFNAALLQSLADDIRERGLINPITVRPHPDAPGRYQVLAGEQRTRAMRLAGRDTIPAIIRDLDDAEAEALTAQENLLRADLTLLEEAAQYKALMEVWGLWSASKLAQRLHRDENRVQRVLRLAEVPALAHQVQDGTLTFSQALRALTQNPEAATPPPVPAPAVELPPDMMTRAEADDVMPEIRHGDGNLSDDSTSVAVPLPWLRVVQWFKQQPEPPPVPPAQRSKVRREIAELRAYLDEWESTLAD